MAFDTHLGGLARIPQWFVWRLEWDAEDGKYTKHPCPLNGADKDIDGGKPSNWNTYERALEALRALWLNNPPYSQTTYALGFWLTPQSGYWFLDLDYATNEGKLLPLAEQLIATYPGAFCEWSSSRRGVHIIGRGEVTPGHRNKPPSEITKAIAPLELEFYVQGRGIAFGLDLQASGCADTQFAIQPLLDIYFPPRPQVEAGSRPEWRGPADDDVLIERMLAARQSAAVTFGGKTSLMQLWRGEVEPGNEADMSLASHLAFWTGCDEERIARLMMRSGLKRDKWMSKRPGGTYLTRTISNACATCTTVYQEPQKNLSVVQDMYSDGSQVTITNVQSEQVTQEVWDRVETIIDQVTSCETEFAMHNDVIPAARAANVPIAFQEKVVSQVKRKLDLWGNKMPVSKLRALIFPPTLRGSRGPSELPDWAKPWCFVANGDRFFNTENGAFRTILGFNSVFGKHMPINDQGRRENAAEKCLHFWEMPCVDQVGYRPDQGAFFTWEGSAYANMYSPSSLPPVATSYTAEGIAGIEAFQQHLFDMCGRRQDVYLNLLYWYAHNVQKPGVKIRWSPLIKGVHGDGKTLCIEVLRAAMGRRNLTTTGNATLTASGNFTDWAVGGALNVIEEIMLTGKLRHQLYNSMKEFISNNVVSVNPKGGKHYDTWNCTNHLANTNHNDGLPMEKTDRRWFIVFTPWASLADMYEYCGVGDEAGFQVRTDKIDYAYKNCASEFRAWFLSIDIPPTFNINGSAMMTPEKLQMMASSQDDSESVAAAIIQDGGVGICNDVLSSAMLSVMLSQRAQQDNFDVPKSTALNHMLNRLGFSKFPKIVKWGGRTHTIWIRNGLNLDAEQIKVRLDKTVQGLAGPVQSLNPP